MLKHVQLSPCRSRADTVSLSSSVSYSSLQNGGGSNSPPGSEPLSSRSSSYSSLNEAPHTTTIKVYARCLRPDIEYKTLSISFSSSSRDVVQALLSKYRMRHRDPNLFYLTMEVAVRKAGIKTMLVLDDEVRPAELQSCHPRGDSRFSLQTRRGGLVKIYDSILMSGVSIKNASQNISSPSQQQNFQLLTGRQCISQSQYKSLLISERTTVDELIQILLNCYNSKERVEQFSVYEVCTNEEYERKLHPDDCPLRVQQFWAPPRQVHFRLRRNPDCPRPRRKIGCTWPCDLGLPPLPPPSMSTVRTYDQPPLLRQQSREESHSQQLQPVRAQMITSHQQQPVRAQLINNRHQRSSLLDDTIPQLKSLQLSPVSSSSYTDYENYFYI